MSAGITISLGVLFSWKVGLVLFILSVIALCKGSLPDNGARPMGDMLRWIVWPLFLFWLIGGRIIPFFLS